MDGIVLAHPSGGGWGAFLCSNNSISELGHVGEWPSTTFSGSNKKFTIKNNSSTSQTWIAYRFMKGGFGI